MLMDKRLLIHDFEYYEYKGRNRSKEPEYEEMQLVTDCRIDYTKNYSRNNQSETQNVYAVIFCYNGLTKPFPKFKRQSKVIFDDEEHIITRVVSVSHPFKNELFAYEIEVI